MQYFNTTSLKGAALEEAGFKAMAQSAVVLCAMEVMGAATPSEVHRFLCSRDYPILITSVRRSLSDLSDGIESKIERLEDKKMGPYKRLEYVYQLKNN